MDTGKEQKIQVQKDSQFLTPARFLRINSMGISWLRRSGASGPVRHRSILSPGNGTAVSERLKRAQPPPVE
jgi:hypothetical protein